MLLVVVLVFIIAYWTRGQRKLKNFPPGPAIRFPIVGHLPLLGLEPHKKAASWIPKYGRILGLRFGSYPCVIIQDYKLAKQAFADPAFAGRPKLQIRAGNRPSEGVGFSLGRTWREQRTFAHRRLKQIGGFGTRSMEAVILEQVTQFLVTLRAKTANEQPITTAHLFNIAAFNALWVIIAGAPFKHNDPEVVAVTEMIARTVSQSGILLKLPASFTKHFPSWLTGKNEIASVYKPISQFLQRYIDEHWATHVPGEPRDFIDAYIDEIKSTTDPASSFHISRSKCSLKATIMDLFLAGIETTQTTLAWTCLLLARHPKVQQRLVNEGKSVLGTRLPSLSDRNSMPYTEAVLHEVMRFRPVLPLSIFHATTKPVHFHGFDLPQDTMVFINTYAVHNDRELWGDPEVFRPERWLNSTTGEFVRREGFLAFSTGKRVCLGEQLARDKLFLFLVSLVQAFEIRADPNGPVPTLDPTRGSSTCCPKPHLLFFKSRDVK